tara:strand:+ start:202 stop:1551 length:1350 start_codon:yes stop_codon:yes gene_type:complete
MNSIPVLVEAKKEYTNQLQQILSPRLYEGFKSIYTDILKVLSDEIIEGNNQTSSVVKIFQKSLKDIPLWNNEMIKNEYSRIQKISNCDYFENLIEAVFITNTKILTSVQINGNDSISIKINVPQSQHFIHKCYMECAKEIYKNPYIFDMSRNLTPKEKHLNLRESLSLINHSISNAIRDLLPIRDILKQGLLNETNESTNNSNDEISFHEKQDSNEAEEELVDNEEDEINEEENQNFNENEDLEDNENLEENYDENETEILDENNENNIIEPEDKIIEPIHNTEVDQNSEIKIVGGSDLENNNEIIDNIIENNEPNLFTGIQNNSSDLKEINLNAPSIIKKIDNVEKKPEDKKEIEELIKPVSVDQSDNMININNNLRKIRNKNFIKKKLLGNKVNSSFYQKKYDENLANYNYTSESYLDEDDANISKNNINLDYNSSDDEEFKPVELV